MMEESCFQLFVGYRSSNYKIVKIVFKHFYSSLEHVYLHAIKEVSEKQHYF